MATVLFTTGLSAGDTLRRIARGMMRIFESRGHRAMEVALEAPGSLIDLQELLESTKVDMAIGLCGYGYGAQIIGDTQKNIWEHFEVPFLSLHGDSPAYLFDRHVNATAWHATMYGFADHYDFRMRLPKKEGVFSIISSMIFDAEPYDAIDFNAKRAGKIIFPKNGGNPLELSSRWRALLPKHVADNLFELADILIRNIEDEASCDIDGLVMDMFRAKGVGIAGATKARLFYVAQLDDYLRRVKCVLLAEVLKEFPVEIHGNNWGFLDMSKAKCRLVEGCDYEVTRAHIKSSLAVLNFTPNTAKGIHDRFERAVGMYTACLTNEQSALTEIYGAGYGLTYQFNMESLRNKIAVMLANPDEVVEAGIQASRRFAEVFTDDAGLENYFYTAEAVRLSAISGIDGLLEAQPYFYWPPATLTH